MFLELPLTSYEFVGVDGEVHSFSGCSVVGVFEFEDRLGELARAFAEGGDKTPEQLYRSDKKLRYLIDRCLKLNGIKPEWCSWGQVEQLLLGTAREAAVLSRINAPRGEPKGGGGTQTLAEVVALLAGPNGDIAKGVALAKELPAHFLAEVLEARAKLFKSGDEAQDEADFEAWKQQKLREVEGMRYGRQS